jgi:hypothetical protein
MFDLLLQLDGPRFAGSSKVYQTIRRDGLFAWAENKWLKVLLADLCERKTLLAG